MIEAKKTDMQALPKPEVFVGQDVLELLSSSMYVNPLSVFREYIQNAVDSIDDAIAAGLLSSINEGQIYVNLDHIDRRVVIRDNGIGISNDQFAARMLSLGASAKKGTNARGFRGVGRLSALGYVQQLVFRSRAKGDTDVYEAVWDGRVVKRLLASKNSHNNLQSIVDEAVALKRLDPEDYPTHFFEVELVKPRRIANDRLLNEVELENFISQVCPCPFAPEFSFGQKISELLAQHGRAGNFYNIFINDAEQPVYRPYRNEVAYTDVKKTKLHSIKTFEIPSMDGEVAAVGWIIHHDYQGSIPTAQGVRGLRARVGNIQIGHDRLFLEIFPEDRFCSWTIGEVHILDGRVVPNGRRDEFESNVHLDNIVSHLRPYGAEIARECRVSSQRRNRLKSFEIGSDKVYEKLEVIKQGAVSDQYVKSIKEEIGSLLSEMTKVVGFELFEESDRGALKGRLATIEQDVDVHTKKVEGDILSGQPEEKKEIYAEVFDLIYECSVNQVAAKSLIDRMMDRLSRE